jgi:hypothetical protein
MLSKSLNVVRNSIKGHPVFLLAGKSNKTRTIIPQYCGAYVEMKVRTLLTRRKRRQKRSIGWRRWSNEYLYDVLGLYWDWKIYPLRGADCYK